MRGWKTNRHSILSSFIVVEIAETGCAEARSLSFLHIPAASPHWPMKQETRRELGHNIQVRQENAGDTAGVRRVNEEAFGRSAEANLVDDLRSAGKVILSLVATEDDHVVGHILFSPVTIDPGRAGLKGVGLAPMAVLSEYQGRGVGSLLVRAGLAACREAGYDCVVVLGHPEYYLRFGFIRASDYGLRSEYDVRSEAFMLIELREGALRGVTGTVRYQPEFSQV